MLDFILIGIIADALETEGQKVREADERAGFLGRSAISAEMLMNDMLAEGRIAEAEQIGRRLPLIIREANEAQLRFEQLANEAGRLLFARGLN